MRDQGATVGTESRTSATGAAPAVSVDIEREDLQQDAGHDITGNVTDDVAEDVEEILESDVSLAPVAPSHLLVPVRVLDEAEVAALLEGLSPLLEQHWVQHTLSREADHESHAASVGCDCRDPQLSP